MLPLLPYTIAGRKRIAYWFFAALAVPFAGAWLANETDGFSTAVFLAAWALLSALIYAFCGRTKIILSSDGMVYVPAVGKAHTVRWPEITAADIEVLPSSSSVSFSWVFQRFSGQPVEVALGYFSRKDMRLLAQQVTVRTKGARISPQVQKIAEGDFPWWLF